MDPKTFASDAPGGLQYDPGGFWCFHPYALPPLFRWNDVLVTALSEADRAVTGLAVRLQYGPPQFARLIARVEAAAACRLAGIDVGLTELLTLEAGYTEPPDPRDAAVQAAAYAMALEAACAHEPPDVLSLDEIERIHEKILPGTSPDGAAAGVFRSGPTWIGPPGSSAGRADFVPPPPDVMAAALESLESFIRAPPRLPALVRLGLIHYQFEVIHPFYEANGRMGRLLNALLLCRYGLLPGPGLALSPYLLEHRDAYEAALSAVSRENKFEAWLQFFLAGIVDGCARTNRLLTAATELGAAHRAEIAGERTEARLQAVIEMAMVRPYFSVGQVDAIMPRGNFKSAARTVERLAGLGMVEETTGQARHRVFRLKGWAERLAEIA